MQKITRRSLLTDCTLLLAATLLLPDISHGAKRKDTVLVLGDSLSAEYGIPRGTGWVKLMERHLLKQSPNSRVINASISGDTTAGGLARFPALLERHQPTIVIIELGSNDALRGTNPKTTRDNLVSLIQLTKAANAKPLLVGMQMPPNYGRRYGQDFALMYQQIAESEQCALVPFLLSGVADVPDAEKMFQADRIHPLAKAQGRMWENVRGKLETVLG